MNAAFQGQTAPPPAEAQAPACNSVCPDFHEAIELIGRRWTGAILCSLIEGPRRFGELGKVVPGLSDRLLPHRLRELGHTLEARELDVFYHRFVELADRKKAIYDQDLVALATQSSAPATTLAEV